MCVDVCEVGWIREIAVQEVGEKESLDFGWEEGWDDVEAWDGSD